MTAATSKPSRRGRPPLKSGEAKRASFNTRLRNTLKERLEESARAAGRSLSEEIESRLERSFDRTESLGGPEYEALFQMMAAAARVIEFRLGKSPFSDPEGSGVARNAWRQIIQSVTADPLEGEVYKESLRITDEMKNWNPPARPNPKQYSGLGTPVLSEEEKFKQDQEEMREFYQRISKDLTQKVRELTDVANEAASIGLSFPEHR
jgi:hypothetical protein